MKFPVLDCVFAVLVLCTGAAAQEQERTRHMIPIQIVFVEKFRTFGQTYLHIASATSTTISQPQITLTCIDEAPFAPKLKCEEGQIVGLLNPYLDRKKPDFSNEIVEGQLRAEVIWRDSRIPNPIKRTKFLKYRLTVFWRTETYKFEIL